jgi:hypothetical protein
MTLTTIGRSIDGADIIILCGYISAFLQCTILGILLYSFSNFFYLILNQYVIMNHFFCFHFIGSFYSISLTPILLVHIVECKSWAYFLATCTCKVGRIFVGETERQI